MRYLKAIAFLLAISIWPPVLAEPTSPYFGANAETAVARCQYFNDEKTSCLWTYFQGYDGHTVARALGVRSVASDATGLASASAEIDPLTHLPALHAYARSDLSFSPTMFDPWGGSSLADSNVWGVQGYKYNGTAPFLLTVTATLEATFSNPGASTLGNHSNFLFNIFDTAGYSFDYTASDDFNSDRCPIQRPNAATRLCLKKPIVFARDGGSLTDTGSLTRSISHLLNPGDMFYVGAYLDASVCCLGTVDASHSLSMTFNDASQLSSIAVAGVVPEPDAWLQWGLGLFALAFLARTSVLH